MTAASTSPDPSGVPPANEPQNPEPRVSPEREYFASRIQPFTLDELLKDPEPAPFIYDSRIPDEAGKVALLVAPGGTGKSSFTVGLAVYRALGLNFLGVPTKPGRTVFVTREDSREDYRRKLAAWRHYLGERFDAQKVAQNVFVFDLVGDANVLTAGGPGASVANDAFATLLAETITDKAPGADLVVVETASRMTTSEDNSGMAALCSALEILSRKVGATVVIVHHTGKEAARSGARDAYTSRGASSLPDNARAVNNLAPYDAKKDKLPKALAQVCGDKLPDALAEETLVLFSPKVNGAKSPEPLYMRRVSTPWAMVFAPIDLARLTEAKIERDRKSMECSVRYIVDLVSRAKEPYTVGELRKVIAQEAKHGLITVDPADAFVAVFDRKLLATKKVDRLDAKGIRRGTKETVTLPTE